MKGELVVEEFGPISSNLLKYREGNASHQSEQFPVTNGLSRALFESSNKKVQTVKLESSRGLLSLLKEVHPQTE
jgi:hypothetical protein